MVGDPQQIRALASRLRADAEQLRRLATRVGRTGDVAWRSLAATLFRERVGERAQALQRTAEELDEAARWVDAHADGVELAQVELARVAGLASDLASDLAANLARSARDAMGRVVGP